ncbi:MAG: glycosyltransferase family 39 protein [Deltaproteobacteria bacterium]|nr:glycosyltransferase family 39 protein [Deltaproteobacteria bacterium]
MKNPRIRLGAAIVVLAASNLLVSTYLGLGDGEALYYCYGLHPSLSYLDHPPLIGWLSFLAIWVGGPEVLAVRTVSLVMTALSLVFTYRLTSDLFGSSAAGWSVLLLASAPVFSVGMVAVTPDAPLAVLWPLFTWQLHRALADKRTSPWSRIGRPVLLGLLLGLAFLAKYTGACLVITALIATSSHANRVWLRRPGFWLGALVTMAVASPVIVWNVNHEWVGLFHRLVWTQEDAGLGLRNAGALIGGQLLYVGPLTLPLLVWAAVYFWKNRSDHPQSRVLLAASFPALCATYLLVLWSKVAEPHWPAAGYLPLFAAAGGLIVKTERRAKMLARVAIGFGLVGLVTLHIVVLTPLVPMLAPKDNYYPEYDLANELRGWPEVADTIRAINPNNRQVLAAFYTQCSQLEFVLSRPDDPEVRCVSPEVDDFDIWYGDFVLPDQGALFVTDNRFNHDPEKLIPGAKANGPPINLEITRGGRQVRQFRIFSLKRSDWVSL